MAQAASQNREVRIFFANVSEITTFFSHSTQRVQILDKIVGRRLPSGSTTRWNFHSRTILTIFENKNELIECFEEIENTSKQTQTINQSMGIRLKMQQPSFIFWLEFFYRVMPHVDILYNSMQSRNMNSITVKAAISSFINELKKIRETVNEIVVKDVGTTELRAKRKLSARDEYISRNGAAKEVCDVIINQAEKRSLSIYWSFISSKFV